MIRYLRKLPLIAALIGFVAAFAWLDGDKQFKREVYPECSLFNTSPKGASLAFRYLKESRGANGGAVKALYRRVEFAELEPDAVVFRIGPTLKPGERKEDDPEKSGLKSSKKKVVERVEPLLTPGESKWVESGGRLVLALDANYGPLETENPANTGRFEKTFDLWPNVVRFDPKPLRVLKGSALDASLSIFTLNDEPYAVRIPMGKGEVIAIASPEVFRNAHLDQADNLQLLEQLAPAPRPVYFDEFVHGMHAPPGIFELFARWGLGMALLVLSASGLLFFWRARKPVGPPEDDHKETRTEAIDFVGTLAPLYNRALEPHQAIALYYKNFVHTVTAQSGLRGADLRAKIDALLGTSDDRELSGQVPLTNRLFQHGLSILNEAYRRLERAHRR